MTKRTSFAVSGDIESCLGRIKNTIEENGFFTLSDVFSGCIPKIWKDYAEACWYNMDNIVVVNDFDDEYFVLYLN